VHLNESEAHEVRICLDGEITPFLHRPFIMARAFSKASVVSKGKLYTTPLASVLEGITRDSILVLAGEMSLMPVAARLYQNVRGEAVISDKWLDYI
jgi:hypothetical protein